jgi:Tol biopolymer transport system component
VNRKFKRLIILTGALILLSGTIKSHEKKPEFQGLRGKYLGQKPPGETPEVFAEGIISHGFHEHHLTISPDGDEMFYVSSSGDHMHYVIIQIKKENDVWLSPEIAPLSGNYNDMGPRFSSDGKKLYFCSDRPLTEGLEENETQDIWVAEKYGEVWSEPKNLGGPINTEHNETFPSLSSNGTMYFQYFKKKKGSESDIYFSRFENGAYQEPEKLEYGISSEHYDASPFVSPDESYLLFQSIRPDGYGGTNLYISFKNENGTWSNPTNLGETINSKGNIIAPMISPDGKYLFFATNGPEDASIYKGKSYIELINLFKSYRNGYGTHYWVEASFLNGLKSGKLR